MPSKVVSLALLSLLLGMVGCDHATKAAATEKLTQGPVNLMPGVDLFYARNHDVAFSALSHLHLTPSPIVLAILPALLSIVLAVKLWQTRKGPPMERAAYLFLLGGALGNLGDRIARGYVVDFIYVHHWPVFNVADVLVVIGMGLFAIAKLRERKDRDADPGSADPGGA